VVLLEWLLMLEGASCPSSAVVRLCAARCHCCAAVSGLMAGDVHAASLTGVPWWSICRYSTAAMLTPNTMVRTAGSTLPTTGALSCMLPTKAAKLWKSGTLM
jgi:hypothetical protein